MDEYGRKPVDIMDMENLTPLTPQDAAERFVLGMMEGAELDDFLARQLLDPSLRAEVVAARERIKTVRGLQQPAAKSRPNRRWFWLIPIALLLGGGVWNFLQQEDKPAPLAPAPPVIEPIAQQTPIAQPKEQDTNTSRKQPTLATNLKPNPVLEYQLGPGRFRDNTAFQWLQAPATNMYLSLKSGQAPLTIDGFCNTNQSLHWQIYSNKPTDYEAGNALFQGVLQPEKQSEGRFQIRLQQSLTLQPGLYYYLLEHPDDGDIYFVGKIIVVQ